MEPLSIFGLVANITQFMELSAKLLQTAHEIHQSSTGHTAELAELHQVSESMLDMCDGLSSDLSVQQRHGVIGRKISAIAVSAKAVAQELMAAIETLRLNDGSKRRWRSFLRAIATWRKKDEIENLQRRLGELRSQLHAVMTTHVSVVQDGIAKDLNDLLSHFKHMNSPRTDSIEDLITQTKSLTLGDLEKTRLEETERVLSNLQTSQKNLRREKTILDSLRFEAMLDRYNTITEAHQTTFNWIFEPEHFSDSDPRSRIAFKQWLQLDSGIFWVAGKPGSGKSTLMRYLCDCQNTTLYLRSWAGSTRLVTAAFYFWMAGTELQRSQRGLLRQLLFEILREYPDLIPRICSERWTSAELNISMDWRLDQLRDALNKLKGVSANTKICFFVDGLDEYDGDHLDLVNIVRKISEIPNIKLCVSSRRWPVFEDAFGTELNRKLHLEDLTRHDIRRFAQDKLEESPRFDQLRTDRVVYVDLVEEIVRKAQGVFLWVSLVVRSLRNGLSYGDNATMLRRRLDEIPSDLEEFFEKLLRSVDPIYKTQLAVVLKIALCTPEPINLVTYWLLDEDTGRDDFITDAEAKCKLRSLSQLEQEMSRRLYGRYKGLLEASRDPGRQTVNFLHRTVRDYLQTKSDSGALALPQLDPYSKACRAFLAYAVIFASSRSDCLTTLDNFITFAQRAILESQGFDLNMVGDMWRAALKSFRTDIAFLQLALLHGFTSGLQYLLTQHPEIFEKHGELMLKHTFYQTSPQDSQLKTNFVAHSAQFSWEENILGGQSTTDTLVWLIDNGVGLHSKSSCEELLIEFLICQTIRGYSRSLFDGWRKILRSILRHGTDVNRAIEDPRLILSLPWVTGSWPDLSCIPMYLCLNAYKDSNFEETLEVYSALLENGLDPNRHIGNASIWQRWLWYICELQLSHGLLDQFCASTIELFLSHGADPHEVINFRSERLLELFHPPFPVVLENTGQGITSVDCGYRDTFFQLNRVENCELSVSFIVRGFFGIDRREVLESALEDAMRRWRDTRSSIQPRDFRGPKRTSELEEIYPQFEALSHVEHWNRSRT